MTAKKLLLIITTGLFLIFVGQFISGTNLAQAFCYNCYTAVYDAYCWSDGYDTAGKCPRSERWDYRSGDSSDAACGGTENGYTDYVVKNGDLAADQNSCTPPVTPPPATPPTATITGDTSGVIGQTLTYNATVTPGSNPLTNVEILVTKKTATGTELPSTNCTGAGTQAGATNWCRIKSGAAGYNPSSWIPQTSGTYLVTLNVFAGSLQCTGYHPNATGSWTRCDPVSTGDSVTVTVSAAPVGKVDPVTSSDQTLLSGNSYQAVINKLHKYTAVVTDIDGNVVQGEIWVGKVEEVANGSNWTGNCPSITGFDPLNPTGSATITRGPWCLIGFNRPSGAGQEVDVNTASWTPQVAGDYYVVVNGYDNTENKCSGSPTLPAGWQDCGSTGLIDLLRVKVVSPPSISSLQVSNSDPNQTADSTGTKFKGNSKVSGLQGSEGGKNWLNPMNITLNATADGAGNSIKQYFVAYYDKSVGPAYSSIIADPTTSEPNASLKSLLIAHPDAGFLLAYDATASKSYVWDPTSDSSNKWVDITTLGASGKNICGSSGCGTQLYYTVFPGNTLGTPSNPKLPHSWDVQLYKNFGGKTMYTAGFVTDNNSLTTYQSDINP